MSGNVNTTSPDALAKQLDASWDTPEAFFDALAKASVCENDDPTVESLIQLHHKFGRNIIERAQLLTPASHAYWAASSPLMQASVTIADKPDQVLPMLNHFRKGMEGDLARGFAETCAQTYCKKSVEQAEAFLAACEANAQAYSAFLPSALLGLSECAFRKAHCHALGLCNTSDPVLRATGTFTLGRLNYKGNPKQRVESVKLFSQMAQDKESSVLMATARATGFLLKEESDPELQQVLVSLARSVDAAVQLWTANALVDLVDQHAEPWFHLCLEGLTSVPLENVHNMGPLDRLLSKLLPCDSTAVLDFLSKWAPKQKPCKEMLWHTGLWHALLGRPADLQRFITHCFASDHANCHQLAASLLGEFHFKNEHNKNSSGLEFDHDLINSYSVNDIEFIVRKVIGHGFIFPSEMATLVFSALHRSCDEKKIERIVRDYFCSVILYNYPGTTRPFLKEMSKKGTSRQRRIARAILDDLQPYFDAIAALPQLKEFSPSPLRLHKYRLAENRQMQESMKKTEASGNFILSKIATKIPVKTGHAFFFKQHTGPNENDGRLTDATPMMSVSVSYESPRQYSLDPVGCEYNLIVMRTETRKEAAAR